MWRRLMPILILAALPLAALAATFEWLEYANAPEPSDNQMTHGLRITLEPKEQTVKVGEVIVFKVAIANLGPFPRPAQVIRPLDGSEARWQQPFHDFVARRSDGTTLRWTMVGSRSPQMKALSVADVIEIPEGQSVDPRQGPYAEYLRKVAFGAPGTYEVWYLYYFEWVNRSHDIVGAPADVPYALRGKFTSNAVKVIVTE